jgi:hypothetical protein
MAISDTILEEFDLNPGASGDVVDDFASRFGFEPPLGYLDFMRRSNGGEGFVGARYLILWPLEGLSEQNARYEVTQFAPGLFLFGSSGGGEAYAFDLRQTESTIVSVPFVGMGLKEARPSGATFDAFLEQLATPRT